MNRALRDVVIFVVLMVAAGWGGVWVNAMTGAADPMQGAGTLLWLLVPPLTAIALAVFAGDLFNRLGLGFGAAGSAKWYAVAFLATPVAVLPILLVGQLTGTISFSDIPLDGLVGLAVAVLASTLLKNVFEELSWRGFLTSWLEEAGFAGLANHLITGVIWTLWHVPYWLFFISVAEIEVSTGLSLTAFIFVAFVMTPLQAIFYGELRLVTGSMWPAFVMHTMSNLVTLALLGGGLVVLSGPLSPVLAPGTGGFMYSALLGLAGWFIYLRRTTGEVPA